MLRNVPPIRRYGRVTRLVFCTERFVVGDHVDLLGLGLFGRDIGQKRYELGRVLEVGRFTQYFTRIGGEATFSECVP